MEAGYVESVAYTEHDMFATRTRSRVSPTWDQPSYEIPPMPPVRLV